MKDIKERFLRDIAKHEMMIIRNNGINRHIRFKKPGSINMYFDLITWKGHLCYTGDMGSYLFSRVEDMFTFFINNDKEEIKINPCYWGEKLLAIDKISGYKEWDREEFETEIKKDFEEWLKNINLDKDEISEVKEQFEWEILHYLDEISEEQAYSNVLNFEYNSERPFEDWWEVDTKKYTFRYLWCCHAIVWGIKKFNKEIDNVKNN